MPDSIKPDLTVGRPQCFSQLKFDWKNELNTVLFQLQYYIHKTFQSDTTPYWVDNQIESTVAESAYLGQWFVKL